MTSPTTLRAEWLRCTTSPLYFIRQHVEIYNATLKAWIPFTLWPAQEETIVAIENHQQTIILKARQLGISWIALGYALWLMLFRPASTILLFSRTEAEAKELLKRITGMYNRLQPWMRARKVNVNKESLFLLSNGSSARAFPTTGGRSYTGSLVILDEADFFPDLAKSLAAIKPTIDAGGQLILVSTVDKDQPLSSFKQLFRAAWYNRKSDYYPIFHSWTARPDRTLQWYEKVRTDSVETTGSTDDTFQEYPATVEEALAPRELNKRIPFLWLKPCHAPRPPLDSFARLAAPGPALPGLLVYHLPVPGRWYVIGVDPAEGNPNSDASAAVLLDGLTLEECATLAGKVEPTLFAQQVAQLAAWFNHARILPERNNHGHTFIAAARQHATILSGPDGKPGWLNTASSKVQLYDHAAETIRTQTPVIHSDLIIAELASIEATTLLAPSGMHDDHADAYALALQATASGPTAPSTAIPPADPIDAYTQGFAYR